ncbi:MAG TPA: PPOX class F420-dependent oxidoreductase [Ktedonobacterales bacterium]|nr:PPOX class F420-dependent oxidoreductase [Ktedonobacterales bacterium]
MSTQTAPFAQLHKASYMSLTTFRKSGMPVATPVWFAERDGTVYLFTFPEAGKVKRIRHTARVTFAPCTFNGKVTGPANEGTARILTAPEDEALAEQTLAKKYGLLWRIYNAFSDMSDVLRRRPKSPSVWLAIGPAA